MLLVLRAAVQPAQDKKDAPRDSLAGRRDYTMEPSSRVLPEASAAIVDPAELIDSEAAAPVVAQVGARLAEHSIAAVEDIVDVDVDAVSVLDGAEVGAGASDGSEGYIS